MVGTVDIVKPRRQQRVKPPPPPATKLEKQGGCVVKDDPVWEEFWKWLKGKKMPKQCLTLATFRDTGRGLMATKDIEATIIGTCILALFLAAAVDPKMSQLPPFKEWESYVKILPKDFGCVAVNLPPDVLIRDRGRLLQMILRLQRRFLRGVGWKLDPARFKWGWLLTHAASPSTPVPSSRASISPKGIPTIALAPFLDMLNHNPTTRIQAGSSILHDPKALTVPTSPTASPMLPNPSASLLWTVDQGLYGSVFILFVTSSPLFFLDSPLFSCSVLYFNLFFFVVSTVSASSPLSTSSLSPSSPPPKSPPPSPRISPSGGPISTARPLNPTKTWWNDF
ncbi:hypothetical protein BC829DRAFT_383193 [Chytridium lagenaria]|nr:hypothetical protein BC829DRAFT_383193 [Chytridium lagenaria]